MLRVDGSEVALAGHVSLPPARAHGCLPGGCCSCLRPASVDDFVRAAGDCARHRAVTCAARFRVRSVDSAESAAVGVAAPLCIGSGELSCALVIVIALTAHLLLGAALCLGGPTFVRRQPPFADQRAYSGESAEHRTPSLSRTSSRSADHTRDTRPRARPSCPPLGCRILLKSAPGHRSEPHARDRCAVYASSGYRGGGGNRPRRRQRPPASSASPSTCSS